MSRILRRLEIVADDWVYLVDADAPLPADDVALIMPFARFRAHRDAFLARKGRLGIRVSPADRIEDIAADVPRIALFALEFTGPGEGRGYTTAKLLRKRYHYEGEVRAVGHVKQDQLYMMARCGIDSFDLSPTEHIQEAIDTLGRIKVAYTPGAPLPAVKQERFHVAS